MKKSFILILLFITIGFANNLGLTKAEKEYIDKKKIVLVSNELDYQPYDFYENNQAKGYSIDLLNTLLKNIGLDVKYVTKPWNDLLQDLNNKKIDLVHTILKTKQREKKYKFSFGYSRLVRKYVIRKEDADIKDISNLYGKKVGISKGWSEEEFFNGYPKIEKVYFKNLKEKLDALSLGKIDAITNSSDAVHYFIQKFGYRDLKLSSVLDESSELSEYHFITLKEHPHLISILNKAYNNLSVEVLEQLDKKWFGTINEDFNRFIFNNKEKSYLNNKRKIKMCIDPNWLPFEAFSSNKHIGMTADYFEIFEKRLGIPIEVVQTKTWLESLALGEKRECDIFSLVMRTQKRDQYLEFTKEYFKTPLVFASELHNSWVNDFSQLKNKKVGIVKGYAYGEILKNRYPNLNLIEVKDISDGLSKVEKSELYGFIGTLATVGYHIQQSHIGQIKINGKFKENWELGIGVRNDEPILKDIFNKLIDELSFEQHQQILNKWVSIEFDEKQYTLTKEESEFLKTHQTIKFLVRPTRPPFEFLEEGKITGIAIDYINEIAKKIGFKPEFVVKNISFTEAFNQLTSNKKDFDTLLFSVKNEQRAKKAQYGEVYLSYPVMIIANKNMTYISKISDLRNKTVIIEKGFMIKKWLQRDYPYLKIVTVNNTVEALSKLNKGEVDAYVGNMAVANYLIANRGFENIKIAAPSKYGTIDYRFVAPKDIGILSSILTKGYKQLSPSEHNLIQQKWFSSRTIEKTNYSLIWKIILVFIFILFWVLWWSRKLQIAKMKTEQTLAKLEYTKNQLHKQKEEFELIFKYSKDGIAIVDKESKFLNLNDAYLKMTGFSLAQMLEISCFDLIAPEDKEKAKNAMVECFEIGFVENFQKSCIVADNRRIDVNISMSLLPDKKRVLIVAKDVSSLKILEEQTRLASMGQMIGNIAHQWRQPLSLITTSASGVKLKIEYGKLDNDYVVEHMDNIINQSNYLSKTIDNFRNFIKNDKSYKIISIKDSVEQTLSILNAMLKNNYINVLSQIDEDIEINGNENELIEAFINIISNSKDALKENIENEDDRFIFISTKKIDENSLELKILDSGGGIDNHIINRIFEPYFTTKHQLIGTGLGLSMVDKIIRERHGASIKVSNKKFNHNNKKYYGACFEIIFKLD